MMVVFASTTIMPGGIDPVCEIDTLLDVVGSGEDVLVVVVLVDDLAVVPAEDESKEVEDAMTVAFDNDPCDMLVDFPSLVCGFPVDEVEVVTTRTFVDVEVVLDYVQSRTLY